MDEQLVVRASDGRRRAGQLHQHRAGRKTDGQTDVLGIGNGDAAVITVERLAHAVIKGDVAGETVFVVHHKQHRRLVLDGAALTIIVALVGDEVLLAPARRRAAARELVVEIDDIGHLIVAELAEIIRIRWRGEIIRRTGLVVVIRVNFRNALVHEVVRVLQIPVRGTAAGGVVALGEHHALNRNDCADVALIQPGERPAAERRVHRVAQRRVHQPHPARDVFAVTRRLAEMFAEQQRVVARSLGVEATVAAVVIRLAITVAQRIGAVAMDVIEHRLDRAAVAVERRRRVAEKSRRHMLHRVEPEPVALGFVQRVKHRADFI